MKKLLNNKWITPVIALLVGMAIGAIFYPSKSITREETSRYEAKIEKLQEENRTRLSKAMSLVNERIVENQEYKRETQSRMSSLRTENTHLKKRVKERIIKIITPDGTIREEIVRESDTEVVSQIVTDIKQEFNEKVTSIENRWKKVHQSRVVTIRDTYQKKLKEKQHIIDTHSKKEKIEINKRNFGISLGYTTDDQIYSSVTYDIFGPVFLDVHLESTPKFEDIGAGAGIGISF